MLSLNYFLNLIMQKPANFIVVIILVITSLIVKSQSLPERIEVSDDIELVRLTERTFIHITYTNSLQFGRYSSNGVIFVEKGDALLLDTPTSVAQTRKLVEWLKDSLGIRVKGFVPNHWHDDCTGGLPYLKGIGVETWANEMTIEILKKRGLPYPDRGFRDSLTLDLNGKQIVCRYFGAAHSLDNITVWIPSEKILFAGCMAKELNSKGLGNTVEGDPEAYPYTIQRVIDEYHDLARIVIPGHGAAGSIDLLYHTLRLAKGISH